MFAQALGLIFGLIAAPPDPASASGLTRFELAETHMGSSFQIVLYSADGPTARRASRAAFSRIAALDAALSDYDPESELMRLCDRAGGPPVPVGADLFAVLARAQDISERSQGAFDVTVGPVVRLWRRAKRTRMLPDPDQLARARALVDYRLVKLDPGARTVQLLRAGMKLDLGGIAKGYAAQAAIDALKREGIDRALVAGAGDVAVSGPPPDAEGWRIGIAPVDAQQPPARFLLLRDAAVSTSGDAERFVEIDGKRYSHIVDPRTGIGVIDRASVTVVARDGATADGLDTAIYVLGQERGLPLVEATEGAAALVVRSTPSGLQTTESRRFAALPHPR